MKLWRKVIILMLLLGILPGCYDKIYLEDTTLVLMQGLDIDEDKNLVVYTSSPVFNKDAKKKTEEFIDKKPLSLRKNNNDLDTMSTGIPSTGKLQSMLIGKKLLEQENWFSLLDPIFRNAEPTINSSVIVFDGPISEITSFHPEDKPTLPILIAKLISSASQRNVTLDTTLQELHRQMLDKALTPSLPLMRKDKDLKAIGCVLLNESGKYATTLGMQETMLLRILQKQLKGAGSYTIATPELQTRPPINPIVQSKVSIKILTATPRFRTTYQNGKFAFDIRCKIKIRLTERTFSFDTQANKKKLQQTLEAALTRDLTSLIHKIQKFKIDPIGLGIHARAYQYKNWKKVQTDWGEALSQTDIHVKVKTELLDSGVLQ